MYKKSNSSDQQQSNSQKQLSKSQHNPPQSEQNHEYAYMISTSCFLKLSMKQNMNNYNSQLIDHYQNGYPILKESLRFTKDYRFIDRNIFQMISQIYQGIPLPRRKVDNAGIKIFAYQQKISYVVIDRGNVNNQELFQWKHAYFPPDASCYEIQNNIKERQYPQSMFPHVHHSLWICNTTSNSYAQIRMIHQTNQLYSAEMLINHPPLYYINRKFKNAVFILEIYQQQRIFQPKSLSCYSHSDQIAKYFCLCLHKRTFSCSKNCFQSDKTHTSRCIYVKKQLNLEKDQMITVNQGLIGFYNQDNMCFFNTILQCLSHTHQLTQYFIQQQQKDNLNYWSKDSTFGEVALAYGKLIRKQWGCKWSSNRQQSKMNMPLFQTIGRWHPPYTKKNQMDAHQFLCKILDWLKEDLNQNQVKASYRQLITDNLKSNQILEMTKANVRERNDSIIQRLMQGMQKSIINCTNCKNDFATFDTFLTIQLPMADPQKIQIVKQTVNIYYHKNPLNRGIFKVVMPISATNNISQLKNRCKLLCLQDSMKHQIGLYLVTKNKGVKAIKSIQQILNMNKQQEEVFCIQKFKISQSDLVQAVLWFQSKNQKFQSIEANKFFQIPFFIPRMIEGKALYLRVLEYIYEKVHKSTTISYTSFFSRSVTDKTFPLQIYMSNKQVQKQQGKMDVEQQFIQFQYENGKKKYQIKKGQVFIVKFKQHKDMNFLKIKSFSAKEQINKKIIKQYSPAFQFQLNLYHCLQVFCKKQIIQNNSWKCPVCKSFSRAQKVIRFQQLPKILIISLNRFKEGSGYQSFYSKNQKFVSYPQQLDLSQFYVGEGKCKYQLYAVANHIKLGTHNDIATMKGHYHAYIKSGLKWYKFDDRYVDQFSAYQALRSKDAYILFYSLIQ